MSKIHLEKIVDLVGGQAALAKGLESPEKPIKQGHVWNWLNVTIDGIPAEHVIKACELVKFEVTPNQLRPDLYPHPHDGLPDGMRQTMQEAAAWVRMNNY